VALAVAFALHTVFAQVGLSSTGHDAAFGNEHRTFDFLLGLVSPGSGAVPYVFGVLTVALGFVGAARARRHDAGASLVLPFAAAMVVLSAWATRQYWSPVWAPALVSFVPALLWPRGAPASG